MKKNKMMRLASILLVLTLLSTSVISGTFAKYVTTAEGSDSARVAKWGITMTSTGSDTFKSEYDATVVAANGTDDVVAPGTKGSVTYEVDGKPETDYVVTFDGKSTTAFDIYLGTGEYTYEGTGINYVGMNATLDTRYYPLDWEITIATTNGTVAGDGWTAGTKRSFATLYNAMEALSGASVTFDANEECDAVITIAWEWDFDNTNTGVISEDTFISNDVYDTILGDLAASNPDLKKDNEEPSSLNVSYKLTMTATQID